MTVLFLSIEYNYCCGISRSIFSMSQELRNRGHRIILGSPGGTMVNDHIKEGMDHVFLPIYPDSKSVKDFWICIKKIRHIVKTHKIDIIHSHHRLAEFFSLAATLFKEVPKITTAHAVISGKKSFSFRSNKVIAVSDVVKKMLMHDFSVEENRIELIRNIPRILSSPSDSEKELFKKSLSLLDDEFIVAGIGRLHKEKGFDILLEAIKNLQHLKKLRTVIVGKGNELNHLKEYSNQNHLNVTFIDELKEVELIYSLVNVIVVPSRQESAGLVSIEASFFKKPVIASNIGGLKETIFNERTGYLVEPENPKMLSNAIERVYNQKEYSEKVGKQLFDYIRLEYNNKRIVNQVESLYKQLISKNGNS
jgi:glycosyltransferase involved in cell wall biosynthesis